MHMCLQMPVFKYYNNRCPGGKVVTSVHYLSGNIELSVILCLPDGDDNNTEGLSDDLLQLINVYQLKPFKAKVNNSFHDTLNT